MVQPALVHCASEVRLHMPKSTESHSLTAFGHRKD